MGPVCEFSELPTDQCDHCHPSTGGDVPAELPLAFVDTERPAQFAGRCAHCGEWCIQEGDLIVLADVQGKGVAPYEWCLTEHTRVV